MMAGDNTETESAISDSLSQAANSQMFPSPSSPHPDRTLSPPSHHSPYSHSGYPEITPGDSASMANGDDMRSTVSSHVQGTFSFKFTYGNKTHRFRCQDTDYMALRDIVRQKIMSDHLALSQSYVKVGDETSNNDQGDDSWLSISYLDDEDDKVLLASDADMEDAVHLARKLGQDRVRLFVQDSMAPSQTNNDTQPSQPTMTTQPNPDDIHVPASQPTISVAPPPPPPTAPTTTLDDASHQQPDTTIRDENNNRHAGRKHRHMRRRKHDNSDVTSSSDTSDESESDSDMSDYDSDVRYSSSSGSRRRRHRRQQRRSKHKRDDDAQFDLPIPQEMLLPAAITFLGVVILGVFTITKFTSPRR